MINNYCPKHKDVVIPDEEGQCSHCGAELETVTAEKLIPGKIIHLREAFNEAAKATPMNITLGQYHLGAIDALKGLLFKLVGFEEYHKILQQIGEE
jgi:hypothetical protein